MLGVVFQHCGGHIELAVRLDQEARLLERGDPVAAHGHCRTIAGHVASPTDVPAGNLTQVWRGGDGSLWRAAARLLPLDGGGWVGVALDEELSAGGDSTPTMRRR